MNVSAGVGYGYNVAIEKLAEELAVLGVVADTAAAVALPRSHDCAAVLSLRKS